MAEVDDELSERIARLAADFVLRGREQINRANELIEVAEVSADPAPVLREIFSIAHVLKGQGSTFGYQMVTEAAGSLCHLLHDWHNGRAEGKADLPLVAVHLDFIGTVLDERLQGCGDTGEREILERLELLVGAA